MNQEIKQPAAVPAAEQPAAAKTPAIGTEQIAGALKILLEYKADKAGLENRLIEEDKWYRGRHWDVVPNKSEIKPVSSWLFNTLVNKHADAMDNFPSANILPREEDDRAEAKVLSSIMSVVLDQADFEQTYNDVQDDKIKSGIGFYGVFWDRSRHNGLGDIAIEKVDTLNLFWQSGITDIQNSPHVFCTELVDNERLEQMYPRLKDNLGTGSVLTAWYENSDNSSPMNKSNKSLVVDWYYKKLVGGKWVLHYCKFVGDEILYATENDTKRPTEQRVVPETGELVEVPTGPSAAERGLYDHGMYPFIPDVLFRQKGTIAGFGHVAVGKSAQEFIDRGNQAIMENMLANASGRLVVKENCDIKEEDVADYTKKVIRAGQNFNKDQVLELTNKPLDSVYLNVVERMVDMLKETTGNRDVSNGGTSGVTAASAIAAMQEAGSKLSRNANKGAYRSFRKIVLMVIELIRQFYDVQRQFRIVGEGGREEFVAYSNANIKLQTVPGEGGAADGYRLPLFDVEVVAQKASPYSKMSQNELALQFFNAGFFNPAIADQALACLDMMDFDRKDFVVQKVQQQSQMYQLMQMLMQGQLPLPASGGQASVEGQAALGDEHIGESHVTADARERVAESTAPR